MTRIHPIIGISHPTYHGGLCMNGLGPRHMLDLLFGPPGLTGAQFSEAPLGVQLLTCGTNRDCLLFYITRLQLSIRYFNQYLIFSLELFLFSCSMVFNMFNLTLMTLISSNYLNSVCHFVPFPAL